MPHTAGDPARPATARRGPHAGRAAPCASGQQSVAVLGQAPGTAPHDAHMRAPRPLLAPSRDQRHPDSPCPAWLSSRTACPCSGAATRQGPRRHWCQPYLQARGNGQPGRKCYPEQQQTRWAPADRGVTRKGQLLLFDLVRH